jgi:hypothetical protein
LFEQAYGTTAMAMRLDPDQKTSLEEMIGHVDLYRLILGRLSLASCSALMCAGSTFVRDADLIGMLGDRLHHGFDRKRRFHNGNAVLDFITKVTITPYYENRIPHWRLHLEHTANDIHDGKLMQKIDISYSLGSFVRVGNFMWNPNHNINMLAMDKLVKTCTERPDGTDFTPADCRVTNRDILSLARYSNTVMGVNLLGKVDENRQLVSVSSDTRITFRKKTDVLPPPKNAFRTHIKPINDVKCVIAPYNPYKFEYFMKMENMDDRSPVDAKPNAPSISNYELVIDHMSAERSILYPYRKVFDDAYFYGLKFHHDSAVIFASFGVAGVASASYEDPSRKVDEALKTMVYTMTRGGGASLIPLHFRWDEVVAWAPGVHPPLF